MKQQNLERGVVPVHQLPAVHGRRSLEDQLREKQRNVAIKHPAEQWGHWVLKWRIAFDLMSKGHSFLMEARVNGLGDGAGFFETGQYDLFCPEEETVYEICDGDLSDSKIANRAKYGYKVVFVEWLNGYALRLAAKHRDVPIWLAYHEQRNITKPRSNLVLLKDPRKELLELWARLLADRLVREFKDPHSTVWRRHTIYRRFGKTRDAKREPIRETFKFYSTDAFGPFTDRWSSPMPCETGQVLYGIGHLGRLRVYNGGDKGLLCVLTELGLKELQKASMAKNFDLLSAEDFLDGTDPAVDVEDLGEE